MAFFAQEARTAVIIGRTGYLFYYIMPQAI
jgi:hypothetical protein